VHLPHFQPEYPIFGECNTKTQNIKAIQQEAENSLLKQIAHHLLLQPTTNIDKYRIQQLECQDITSKERLKMTDELIGRFQNQLI
jgi:hypothetical protein